MNLRHYIAKSGCNVNLGMPQTWSRLASTTSPKLGHPGKSSSPHKNPASEVKLLLPPSHRVGPKRPSPKILRAGAAWPSSPLGHLPADGATGANIFKLNTLVGIRNQCMSDDTQKEKTHTPNKIRHGSGCGTSMNVSCL